MMTQKNRTRLNFNLAGLALFLFLILMAMVLTHNLWLNHVDQWVFNRMANIQTTLTTQLVETITNLGSPIVNSVLVAIGGIVLWLRQQYRTSLMMLGGFFGGSALTLLFKFMVQRPRPSAPLQVNHGFSFPSGHAFTTMMLTLFVIVLVFRLVKVGWLKWTLAVFISSWAGLVMLSRVYLRAHYFSDVIAGSLLAISLGLILMMIQNHFEQKNHY